MQAPLPPRRCRRSSAEPLFLARKRIRRKEGVTENLKSTNQMKWVQRMNNIRERVIETVNAELICA